MTLPNAQRAAGKRAFVTGAAGGLGAATGRMLARHGAKVFLTDIDEAAVRQVADDINRELGQQVAWSAAQDVRDEERWKALLAEAAAAMGGLSVLVNNAGIGSLGAIEQIELAEWRRVMAVNVESIMLGCKHALPYLRANQPAAIINISSLAAFKTDPDYTAYNTSKAAVAALTKSVAIDCARQKMDVRCNSVHPPLSARVLLRRSLTRSARKRPPASWYAAFPCVDWATQTTSLTRCYTSPPTRAATSPPPKY